MESLLILGAGELGQAVAEIAKGSFIYDDIAFLDDNPNSTKEERFQIIGTTEELNKFAGRYKYIICAFGNNQVRHKLRMKAKELGFSVASVIHPSAVIDPSVAIGEGVIVRERAAISHKVVLEDGCLINMGVLIDHCCIIGHDTHLPMGSIVRNEIHIPALSTFTPGQVIQ